MEDSKKEVKTVYVERDVYDPTEFVNAYFHGDVDLHNIFRKLGKDLVLRIVSEI